MPILSRMPYSELELEGRGAVSRGPWAEEPARKSVAGLRKPVRSVRPSGLFEICANVNCESGWLHLLRSRSVPVFEGGWNCSARCTAERVQAAVRR